MTVPSFRFEAKKHAYRQTQDGVVIAFTVHPNDVSPDLAAAPLGSHYVVAVAPYDPDTGQPKAKEPPAADAKPKERRPFHSLPRSQQAALACNDERFRQWAPFSRSTLSADLTEKEREATIAADVARHLRETLGVQSRRDLDMNDEAGARWDALYDRYLRETGQQTEMRG